MDSSALLAAFRIELSDTVKPLLWTDDEIYGYMDDAQKTFCRWTGGLGDASSALTQLPLTAGVEWIALSPLILKIRDVYRTFDGRPVSVVNYEDLPHWGIRFDGRTGPRPEALVIGMEPGRVRVYPIPTALTFGLLQLVVDRLPLKALDGDSQKIEIAEQHHINLLQWMKHRAYGKTDADTYDAKKSLDFRASFKAYCDEAKLEKERALHKPRQVVYGGIGGSSRTRHVYPGGGTCRW